MSEIEQKIASIKAKRDEADKSSMAWQAYNDVVVTLERSMKGAPVLKVHETPEVCESCQ